MAAKRPLVLYPDATKELLPGDVMFDALPVGSKPIYRNGSSAAQNSPATADAVLAGTLLDIPAGALVAGGVIYATLWITTTTAGTGILTFRLRAGTLGTIADTAIQTWALAAQSTASTPIARIDIAVNMRGTGPASSSYGSLFCSKNLATGWGGNAANLWLPGTPANIDTSLVTKLHLDLQCSAATPVLAIQTVGMELQP